MLFVHISENLTLWTAQIYAGLQAESTNNQETFSLFCLKLAKDIYLHESGRPATDVAMKREKSQKPTKPNHFPFLNIALSLLLLSLTNLPQFWNIEIYNNTQHHDSRCYICRWILSYVTFCLSQTLWYSPQVKSWWESHILLFSMLRYISGGLKPDKQLSNYITITLQITITENFKEFNTGKKSNKMLVHVLLMTNTCSNLSSSYWWYWW